jgi:hypothetical protein
MQAPDHDTSSRQRILAATAEVLGRNGMTKLSLSAVALQARVSRPTLPVLRRQGCWLASWCGQQYERPWPTRPPAILRRLDGAAGARRTNSPIRTRMMTSSRPGHQDWLGHPRCGPARAETPQGGARPALACGSGDDGALSVGKRRRRPVPWNKLRYAARVSTTLSAGPRIACRRLIRRCLASARISSVCSPSGAPRGESPWRAVKVRGRRHRHQR